MRWFAARVMLTASIVFLTACAVNETSDSDEIIWVARDVDFDQLKEGSAEDLPSGLLKAIQADYAKNKVYGYNNTRIELTSVYTRGEGCSYVLFFDVLYVDDIQVVYEADNEGNICQKYVFSMWH